MSMVDIEIQRTVPHCRERSFCIIRISYFVN